MLLAAARSSSSMVSVIRMATTYTARPLLARCLTSAQGASPILGMPPSDLACPARSALAKAGVAGGGIQAPATQGGREPNIADAPSAQRRTKLRSNCIRPRRSATLRKNENQPALPRIHRLSSTMAALPGGRSLALSRLTLSRTTSDRMKRNSVISSQFSAHRMLSE